MVLKRCRWSFGSSGFTLRVKVCDSALTRDCRCVKSASVTRRLTTTSSSFAASFSSFERQSPLRWRLGLVDLCVPGQTSVRELQSSSKALQYDLKPDVPKSEGRTLFFDTHAIVRLLEEHGFTTPQAEVIVKVLVRTTSSNMDLVYSDMVTKVQQEIMLQQVMSKIATVKKDMVILEKSEFSTLLAENEKLNNQLLQLKVQLADVMNKVRSDNILDMNLEKSSVKELKAMHDKKLLEARTEILGMIAEHDGHLTQTNMKIDTELAGLKTMLEAHKLDTIKYLAGSVFTCLTVVLGFYRIWM